MNFQDYQTEANKTSGGGRWHGPNISFELINRTYTATLGLAGKAIEFKEAIRSYLSALQERQPEKQLSLFQECGDVLWYVAELATCFDLVLEFPQGVTWQASLFDAAGDIVSAAGRIAEMVKKHLGHGHDLDGYKLRYELQQILLYIAQVCVVFNTDIEAIARQNLDKLAARYGEKFSSKASINRVEQ